MLDLRQIERDILSTGKVDGYLLEVLRQGLYADGKINRRGADFLAELYKRVQHRTPAFEQFFDEVIDDHVLTNGGVNPEGTDHPGRPRGRNNDAPCNNQRPDPEPPSGFGRGGLRPD